ncbi:8386_t:CDS:2 [Entrophospora sp. SA101]|nr:8386_t:CDS:2 [Entrophospora sp. SA101]
MVGSPAKIGFYSKNTRNLEMMNNKESFGTDLGDIFNMSSLNNSLSRVFGNLLDGKLKIISYLKLLIIDSLLIVV